MWISLVEEEGEVYTKQSGQQLLQLFPPPPKEKNLLAKD